MQQEYQPALGSPLDRANSAIRGLEEALEELLQTHGQDHPDTLRIQHRLAHACRAAKDFHRAIALFELNVAAWTRLTGASSQETLRSRSSLANCYYAAGRYHQAIPLFEEILRDRRRALGPHHPDTRRSRGSLANSYRALGALTSTGPGQQSRTQA
jgi:tetratricopeptide (TPR) repeat protein